MKIQKQLSTLNKMERVLKKNKIEEATFENVLLANPNIYAHIVSFLGYDLDLLRSLVYLCKQSKGCFERNSQLRNTLGLLKDDESKNITQVISNWNYLNHVKDQTKKMCLEAVKQNGWALEYVKNQTEEMCLKAVKQNGYALIYVRKQTEEICLAAVKQDGYALHYVKDQTEEIIRAAIKQNPDTEYLY